MTEQDKKISNNIEISRELQNQYFDNVSSDIRKQLMINRELIEAYNTWNRNATFDKILLTNLEQEQYTLEEYFNEKWKPKIVNSNKLLRFDKPYCSQTFIIVEQHAGMTFRHLLKRYILFKENGFFSYINEKAATDLDEAIDRLQNIKTNYNNVYHLNDSLNIEFELSYVIFKGELLIDGIMGNNVSTYNGPDKIIENEKDIYILINNGT